MGEVEVDEDGMASEDDEYVTVKVHVQYSFLHQDRGRYWNFGAC